MIVINGEEDDHLEMLQGGVMRQLLDDKWKTYARVSWPLPLSGQIQQMTNWWYFSYFSQKIGFGISWKLSPKETMCLKCQNLFAG